MSISGISGQDGHYLTRLLIRQGYTIHGLLRPSSEPRSSLYRNDSQKRVLFHYGDVLDFPSLIRILQSIQPSEIYHLAAQSQVHRSFDLPLYTSDVDALGTMRILEAILFLNLQDQVRFYNVCLPFIRFRGKADD